MKHFLKMCTFQAFVLSSFISLLAENHLLTDPILQAPTASSVTVVWFTDDPGQAHYVQYGEGLSKQAPCTFSQLDRMREDSPDGHSWVFRPVYKHAAVLENLSSSQKTPYCTVTVTSSGETLKSETFQCSPIPDKGSSLKILFTSDHQGKPMVAANLQKVKEVVPEIDALFFAGDLVDHADRASEWFGENGFFACLQGKASKELHSSMYTGGALLQSAPTFCAMGNHELMGRWSDKKNIDEQLRDAYPRELAELQYDQLFPHQSDTAAKEKWIQDHSFNSVSYEQLFNLPQSIPGGKKYYAVTFGDIRLVVLHAARIWRNFQIGSKGKYTEPAESFDQPLEWGYGDFIFEPIHKGSTQYEWLENELQSAEFQNAKYKIIMLHHPLHSLGGNSVPAFTNPLQHIETDANGVITAIEYDYPKESDVLIRDIEPLLIQYGVDFVLYGHSHLWNRFRSASGIHYLETSNVGNSHGAYLDTPRNILPSKESDNYRAYGDPNDLAPVLPTIAPLSNSEGAPLPYIASNTITVFSIFSTDTGAIDSYYFDTTKPDSAVVHFDRFYLGQREPVYEWAGSIQDLKQSVDFSAAFTQLK